MLDNIRNTFSIKDLENLSGIKAHTIRIWEKRYNLLSPNRSDTNIRNYSLESLQKLLNIALLNENGVKISKIASLNSQEINIKVREYISSKSVSSHAKNTFKIAMLNFDQALFDITYNKLLTQFSFREIFLNIFIDFLEEIGLLWQSDTITPAHEHFITNLIKQKLLINTERIQLSQKNKAKTFVLFLPLNEIHELGLLYINFELTLKGYQCIYLGQSVPAENLKLLIPIFDNVHFISYFTIEPKIEEVNDYIANFENNILETDNLLHLLGRNSKELTTKNPNIKLYQSITQLTDLF